MMKAKFVSMLVSLLLVSLIVPLIVGCQAIDPPSVAPAIADGQVTALYTGSTIWGIKECLRGAAGSFIYQNGNNLFFSWAIPNQGFGFVALNPSSQSQVTIESSNLVNNKTFADFLKSLESNGWSKIEPKAVPGSIVSLLSYTITSWISGIMPTFFVIPIINGEFPDVEDLLNTEVQL